MTGGLILLTTTTNDMGLCDIFLDIIIHLGFNIELLRYCIVNCILAFVYF